MLILRGSGIFALGTTMERMPFFRLALTASWSTRMGKVKERWNSPTGRSVTQYFPASAAGTEVSGSLATSSWVCESTSTKSSDGLDPFSSSTVGWWDLGSSVSLDSDAVVGFGGVAL